MTQWLDFALDSTTLLHLFQSLSRAQEQEFKDTQVSNGRRHEIRMPNGQFGSVSYVKIYANCRVRRIWFVSLVPISRETYLALMCQSESGEKTMRNVDNGEFALYTADTHLT